ncbi:atrial natriuretic peptide receptor 3-like protein [Dinothrombium tinctorium]|uniref:Atrial natriuretic peptide receptor 3-like protein n=1 Tax=Dinothrombium tinctorium TaxID=1965070 RepID=A0A3S3S194_9ACAR|nr:atrial natriuretic peptide receptor 3-like protein [Dinothrombium tinctorium]RWS00639.1 atrial natriuretic peptide receptor 3-like protein [Dinothrombium tinctorium]RWS07778.1 atrial natriuretic peptide receptor 3-like protein [Dinothrombium tinctorium]
MIARRKLLTLIGNIFMCVELIATISFIDYDRSSNDTIRVTVLLPNSSAYLSAIPRVAPAIELAIEKIKELKLNATNRRSWQIAYHDSNCSDIESPMVAVRAFIEEKTHLFLGH